MTWHAAARAADATAFARGVITSKLVLDAASGPEDPVCRPLLSFLCSCDFLLWSCKLGIFEDVIVLQVTESRNIPLHRTALFTTRSC